MANGRLYFTALKSLERLEIQYVPKELTIARNPSIAGVAIVGRNLPQHHYLSGVTELRMELDFHSDDVNRDDVIRKCKWLESLAYSDDDSPPERVRLTFGRLFNKDEVWIVKSVTYRMSLFDDNAGFLPKQAYAALVLALDTDRNLKVEDVKWN